MLKMNFKKINRLVKQAKKHYNENSNNYDKILSNKTNFIPLNYLVGKVSNESMNNTNIEQNQNNDVQDVNQNVNFSESQSQIQGQTGPISIVAKNYIDPSTIEGMGEGFKERKIKKSKSHELAKIPNKLLKNASTDWEPINYKGVDDSYELYKLSSVEIKYNKEDQKLMYTVLQPDLTDDEKDILEDLKKAFIYVFERISPSRDKGSQTDLIISGTKKLCRKYGIKLDDEQFKKITYYLERDFLGLERIEPLMYDPYIEDVSCDGLGVPIFINHLKYGALETNIVFKESPILNSFIIKLAQKSNQEVSLSKPILQGALPDGSRVEAIYGKEVSEKGSSFTIRKFRAEPMTPIHLIELGTMPSFLLAYLWLAVENKQSILVSGGTATGKTTILNALSLFVTPSSKIVSIEDTPEINLPHEHWLPLISRETEGKAEVSMFDLLKASLRERPEYIIVGEIRGAEAAILFQGMATGHAGLGTVHAEKFNDLVNRMTIAPINLPKQLLTELNIVVFMKQIKIKDNLVRRVSSVVEVVDYDAKSDTFDTNEFLAFTPFEDSFSFSEKSAVISHLIEIRGGKEESLWTEIEKRRRILESMYENGILEFRDVSEIIQYFYKDTAGIFEFIDKITKRKKDGKKED